VTSALWVSFQGLIIFAVVATNIHWHWTPNGYIPAMAGIVAAWIVTWLANLLLSPLR
jgi:hypothetical protein